MMRKSMAKLGRTVLALVLGTLLLAGCAAGGSPTPAPTPGSPSGSAPQGEAPRVYKIGIIQLAENGAFQTMREGFLARLKELGYTDEMLEIDYQNAQGDVGTLNTICQGMAKSDKDLVVTIATPAAQAYVSQESDIPLVFISVSDPVRAGIMSSLDTPDRGATGSSNLVPVDEIFRLAADLTPQAAHYGFLYNTGEANAVSTVESAKAYLDSQGVTYQEITVTNSSEIQQAAEALVSKVDALYIPIDSMIQSAMTQVAQIAKDAGVPVYGSSPVMVADGALATVSTDDTQVGATSADLADRYLKGTPIDQIPAVAVDRFVVVVNETTAQALGVQLPQAYADAIRIQ